MESEKVSFFLLRNGKFFNKKDIKEVESIVSKVNTDSIANLSVLRFRNPLFMSLLSLVLGIFGVDRFLLGDIKRISDNSYIAKSSQKLIYEMPKE